MKKILFYNSLGIGTWVTALFGFMIGVASVNNLELTIKPLPKYIGWVLVVLCAYLFLSPVAYSVYSYLKKRNKKEEIGNDG